AGILDFREVVWHGLRFFLENPSSCDCRRAEQRTPAGIPVPSTRNPAPITAGRNTRSTGTNHDGVGAWAHGIRARTPRRSVLFRRPFAPGRLGEQRRDVLIGHPGRSLAMTRSPRITAVVAVLTVVFFVSPAPGQTPAEFAQTASYAAAHQNKDGGFAAKVG